MSNTLVSIPLCALTRSKLNIRKTGRRADIEQLAASIASQGLLENLVVRPNGDASYEVIAGARRLAALKLLAKKKTVPDDFPVTCLILMSGETADIVEVSLAENILHAPVHPADQFDAFARLQNEGLPIEDIAARFGMSVTVVRQRLKLAAVAPKLMTAYRKGGLTLEHIMAFTITDDRARQEQVWAELADREPSPQTIRHVLTQSHVAGSDRRALYVGAKAYTKAGGHIVCDLFDEEGEGYFADIELLDQLVREKLDRDAEPVRKEGWGWVEVRSDNAYVDLSRFGRIRMVETALPAEDEDHLKTLSERYDTLVSQLDEDEADSQASDELDRVTAELDALQDKREAWPEDEKNRAGAIVSLDYTGCVKIVRGLVKPEDCKKLAAPKCNLSADVTNTFCSGYAEYLLVDLAAQRTAALQESLARRPDVALVALLHVLTLRVFFDSHVDDDCIAIEPAKVLLPPSVGETKAKLALEKRNARWHERLPEQDGLWSWVSALNRRDKLDLLAYCVATTLDAGHRRGTRYDRPDSTDRIAAALGLDMAAWWKPTKENFFDRLTKAQIVEVVSVACSADSARTLEGLKKSEMAAQAESLVRSTQWLPDVFQTPVKHGQIEPQEKAAE